MQVDSPLQLPVPDAASKEHSLRVEEKVRNRIRDSGGSVSFADFMQQVLYAPGLGYYVAGNTKFGEAGDFVTAPEVSPLFAAVLARQCAEVLGQIPGGSVLELGAGTGVFASAMLEKLEQLDALPEHYCILDVSPDLRIRQQENLSALAPDLSARVRWLDDLPGSFSGVVVANEVADALPVEQFETTAQGILQRRISVENDNFVWTTGTAPDALSSAVESIAKELPEPLPAGYVSDVSLALPAWIGDIGSAIERGAFFLIDYGVSRQQYYAPDRNGGWLRCHFRHFAHSNPLINAGIQDLTCWVDFSAVAAAAAESGLRVDGYLAQGPFLINGGLQEEMTGFTDLDPAQQIELSRQIKLLTLPGEMGENFKCIGMSCGNLAIPSAFSAGDRAHTL